MVRRSEYAPRNRWLSRSAIASEYAITLSVVLVASFLTIALVGNKIALMLGQASAVLPFGNL